MYSELFYLQKPRGTSWNDGVCFIFKLQQQSIHKRVIVNFPGYLSIFTKQYRAQTVQIRSWIRQLVELRTGFVALTAAVGIKDDLSLKNDHSLFESVFQLMRFSHRMRFPTKCTKRSLKFAIHQTPPLMSLFAIFKRNSVNSFNTIWFAEKHCGKKWMKYDSFRNHPKPISSLFTRLFPAPRLITVGWRERDGV